MKIKFQIENVLYGLGVFFTTLSCVLGYWGIETTISYFQVSFYFLSLFYVVVFARTIQKTTELRSFLLICVYILIAVALLYAGVTETPLQAIAFLISFFFLYIILQRNIKKKQLQVFLYSSLIGALLFLFAYLREVRYFANGWTRTILDFNPQNVGAWAYLFCCSCLIGFFYFKNISVRIFLGILIANFVKVEIETDARGSFFALIFVLIFTVFPFRKIVLHKYISFVFAAIPAIFVVLFIGLWKLGLFLNHRGTTLLTDREVIWDHYLTLIAESPLFGDYLQYSSVYSHNIFVDYVIMFGYPLAIFWICFVGYTMSKQAAKIDSSCLGVQYVAYVCFIGSLIAASIEGLVFGLGAGGALIYAYSFLFIAGYNPQDTNKKHKGKIE